MDANLATRTPPTNSEFFRTLLKVGLTGFGGVLPFARRVMVEQKQWLTEAEFAELLSLGQSLPGPNIVNVVVMLGYRHHGVFGALNGVFAILFAPMVIVLSLAGVYAEYSEVPWVKRMMAGIVAAAAAGLILTMGVRMLRAQPQRATLYLLAGGTIAAKLAGAPLLLVLFVFAAIGMFLGSRGAF